MNLLAQLRQSWAVAAGAQRRWWAFGAAAAALLLAVVIFGTVSMLSWVGRALSSGPPAPDVVTLRQVDRHDTDAAMVAMFARWCVLLYEEATPATVPALRQCFPVLPPPAVVSPNAATVSDVDAWAPQLVGQAGTAKLWQVMVAVTVKEFTAPTAVRKFVTLSVALPADGGPRATLLPADRAVALPAGPDVELAYGHEVASSSLLAGVVRGFVTAFLAGPIDNVAQYVTAESGLTGLGQLYDDVTIASMTADVPADGPPSPGQQVHVLATVTAAHRSGGVKPMQYPLLLVEAGGRWAVAAIEDMPAVTGRLLAPSG